MKLICSGSDLADGFTKVIKALSAKKNISILEGVKMSADGNVLTLTGTDTELTIINKINAEVIVEGDIVVDGKFVAELTRKTSGQTIEMNCVDSTYTTFKYIDSKSKVKCMNIEEFPTIIEVSGDKVFISKSIFKSIIDRTIFSASQDEERPILKGCFLNIKENLITAVALDGYRIAIIKEKIDNVNVDKKIIVPYRAMVEISKLLDDKEDVVTLTISEKKMMVEIDNTIIITSLVEGDYIKFEHIIPKAYNTECTIIRNNFEEIIDRASIISKREKSNLITLDINENVMILKAKSDIGDIEEKMTINTDGVDVKIGMNGKYLSDCIKVIKEEFIKLSIVNSTEPCVIRSLEGDGYLYLILPIRVLN